MKKTILLPTYDFDGNILNPETLIVLYDNVEDCLIEVSNHEIQQNPYMYNIWNRYKIHDDPFVAYNRTFDYWYDNHPWPDWLIQETKHALANNLFSNSFNNFKQLALIEANLFAILTARGHGSDNMQRAIQLISDEILSDDEKKDQKEYIRHKYHKLIKECSVWSDKLSRWFFDHIPSYICVNNINYCKSQNMDFYNKTRVKKVLAIDGHYKRAVWFYDKIDDIDKIRFAKWFSDDDVSNIVSMAEYFIAQSKVTDDTYRIYFTGRKEDRDQVKNAISSLLDGDQIKFDNNSEIIMKISI